MNEEERRPSLADAAASWVPPWERAASQPAASELAVPEPAALELAEVREPEPEVREPEPEVREPEAEVPEPEPEVPEPEPEPEVPTPEAEVAPETEPEPAPDPHAGVMLEPETEAVPAAAHVAGAELQAVPEPVAGVPEVPEPVAGVPEVPEAALDPATLRGALEAILLVVDEPTSDTVLAQVLGQPAEQVAATLADLAEEYGRTGRGFELRRAAGGWRLYTRPEFASYVERFVLDGQQVRLTQAALETLAVVAYKQPVTRSRISAIRGVNCDGVVRTLVSRGLIEECGTEPETGAFLYRTTPLFLERLGLDSVAELPPLAPFLPDDVDEIADAQR